MSSADAAAPSSLFRVIGSIYSVAFTLMRVSACVLLDMIGDSREDNRGRRKSLSVRPKRLKKLMST